MSGQNENTSVRNAGKTITAAQMRAIERAAIARGEVTGLALMERAGAGVVAAALAEWPALAAAPQRAVVLCGPGNNGGDGFVVARLLRARGWQVEVFLYGTPDRLPPDARTSHDRWSTQGPVHPLTPPRPSSAELDAFIRAASHPPVLLVDALFGIGLTRPLEGLDRLVRHWHDLRAPGDRTGVRVVAVDVPSGLDADTGAIVGHDGNPASGILPADLTVTFHALKPGHVAGPAARLCGKVAVVDIGLADTAS